MRLKAPFPYFGGKTGIAQQVWAWLGDCRNYVEPFFGSGAVLLSRPKYDSARHLETVNDIDGLLCNFYRALQAEPETVARYADWPVNENDLHARHAWLVGQKESLQSRLEGNPDYYDAKIAGWWVWGMSCWIGRGFCSGKGSWAVQDSQLVRSGTIEQGIWRQRVHLCHAGQGIQRQGVHLGDTGRGEEGLYAWFRQLADRLKRVRVCCGDWSRICGATPTFQNGLTGVFLDPPYGAETNRDMQLYRYDDGTVAAAVQRWCLENGNNPLLRIVLCGYGNEHDVLATEGWRKEQWTGHGGYGRQGQSHGAANRHREACWISPHCLRDDRQRQESLAFVWK